MRLFLEIIIKLKNYLISKNRILLGLFIWLLLLVFFKVTLIKPNSSIYDYSNANFKVLGLNMPIELEFAGEQVPQNDYEIKENLEKEFFKNKSWKQSSISLFRKAEKWFSIIEPILKKEGVPDDFKYVAIIESHLENVISPMGAAGFWQLMPETARDYGLIVNDEIDERYDIEKATHVACKHFKDGYNYFHNWTLSAAAYNIGIGGIQKALKKQSTNNYYDLFLNKETGSFIYRILAYKTLLSNPKHFGVNTKIKKRNAFPDTKIVTVDSSITNLQAFAQHIETDVLTLKILNPWLIGSQIHNIDNHLYRFKIPKIKNQQLDLYFKEVIPTKMPVDTTLLKDSIKTISKTKKDSLHK